MSGNDDSQFATAAAPARHLRDHIFRLLVDQVADYAIFMLSPSGEVTTWNTGAQRIKGFKPHEIIGRHFRIFYPPDAQARHVPEEELRVAAATGRFEDEGWRIRSDGSRFWANVIITAIRDEHGRLMGFGKVTRDSTEKKRSEEQLRQLSHRLLKLQDDERARLGRDLHDTVGQDLVAAKMSLDRLISNRRLTTDDVRQHLKDPIFLVDNAIRQVRTLSYLLCPPMLEEMGLGSAIRWDLEGFTKRSGIRAVCDRCDDVRLPREVEVALFRVFQESLANVHRHSRSEVAHIRFFVEDHIAVPEVQDRGIGLPPSLSEPNALALNKAGVGIRGMHERLRQIGGQLSILSTPPGTTLRATVPIEPHDDPSQTL